MPPSLCIGTYIRFSWVWICFSNLFISECLVRVHHALGCHDFWVECTWESVKFRQLTKIYHVPCSIMWSIGNITWTDWICIWSGFSFYLPHCIDPSVCLICPNMDLVRLFAPYNPLDVWWRCLDSWGNYVLWINDKLVRYEIGGWNLHGLSAYNFVTIK